MLTFISTSVLGFAGQTGQSYGSYDQSGGYGQPQQGYGQQGSLSLVWFCVLSDLAFRFVDG